MKQILVYGDSISWGMVPGTRERYAFDQRWPGVLESALHSAGLREIRIVENCLPGRKTIWDDPFRPGRNGASGLGEVIEMCSPLELVIIQLGTNDFQAPFGIKAWAAASGVGKLVETVRQAPVEPGMPRPRILVVAPPEIIQPKGGNEKKFEGAVERSKGFAAALAEMAATKSVHFFDLNPITGRSEIDGIHLGADQHDVVGKAAASVVRELIVQAKDISGSACAR
jgi:lysophospholipase L1-like esterase